MHFDSVTSISNLSHGLQGTFFDTIFFLAGFMYPIPFCSRIAWVDKLHNLMNQFLPNKGYHGNRKKEIFSVIISSIKNTNVIDTYYH